MTALRYAIRPDSDVVLVERVLEELRRRLSPGDVQLSVRPPLADPHQWADTYLVLTMWLQP